MTKKLLVELTDIIHSEESNKNLQWGPFKAERCTLAACNQQHLLQVSRLSNTEETSVRALQSRAHGSNVCHVAVDVHLVLGWQNYEFQGARTHRVFQKTSGLSECCPLDFPVQKKVYSREEWLWQRRPWGNRNRKEQLPSLTDTYCTGMSFCGQTVQHPPCCLWWALWDRHWFRKLRVPKSEENSGTVTQQLLIIF